MNNAPPSPHFLASEIELMDKVVVSYLSNPGANLDTPEILAFNALRLAVAVIKQRRQALETGASVFNSPNKNEDGS